MTSLFTSKRPYITPFFAFSLSRFLPPPPPVVMSKGPTSRDGAPRIRRGTSCIPCRQKKMKCDAEKPICSSCLRAKIPAQCHYKPFKLKSRILILQEKAEKLEKQVAVEKKVARIKSLRATVKVKTKLVEHRPESVPANPQPRSEETNGDCWQLEPARHSSSPVSVLSATLSHISTDGNSCFPPDHIHTPAALCIRSPMGGWWMYPDEEPPMAISNTLIDVFLHYRSHAGFDLDPSTFWALTSRLRARHAKHDPCVLNAMYLIGCFFHPAFRHYQQHFLSRTRRSLMNWASRGGEPEETLGFIEGNALLACYYYFNGRMLEGLNHAGIAIQFSIACKLHVLCPPWTSESYLVPRNLTQEELNHRVRIWWMVFALDRSTLIAMGVPSSVPDEEIKTVWLTPSPYFLDGEVSENTDTVLSLYEGRGACLVHTDIPSTMRVKALALFERSSRIGAMSADPAYWDIFCRTDEAVVQFLYSLPSIHDPRGLNDQLIVPLHGINPFIVVPRFLAYGAMIRLHDPLARLGQDKSRARCLEAATATVKLIQEIEGLDLSNYLNVLTGFAWQSAYSVYSRELEAIDKTHRDARAPILQGLRAINSASEKLAQGFPAPSGRSAGPPAVTQS
ncbi:hypothetical protein BOTBODRAFT_28587 [Botryobasidium botryosum FD-172 SS1]|uniref:Zn(2)-C6 fungal-type domain-containing protein n=1 Tax=Botryobasidium botryosum (strain FD-172 SS1) TaxID=930990 RepID=A0A067MU02_BOTB1|nr:hypothetical protein BOTBODRAFT_28587 [Botryobasidium botryosum FD-172 SS1]